MLLLFVWTFMGHFVWTFIVFFRLSELGGGLATPCSAGAVFLLEEPWS